MRTSARTPRTLVSAMAALLALVSAGTARADPPEAQPDDPLFFDGSLTPVAAINCDEHKDVGYVQGKAFDITVVTVDGKPVEVQTANAYYAMQQAAAKDGVGVKIVSGFRTMAEQQYLYNCYINCNCNNCNLAAKPGYSNHQSGHALDLNTGATGVLKWLNAHGNAYGFSRTVPSEDWHWEWWGGGPATNGPCGTPDYRAEFVAQSFPLAKDPPVLLEVGACVDAWIDLRNTGKQAWNGDTRLAPTPRDEDSSLYDDATWLSPTRVAAPDDKVAPGQVGHFAFRLCAGEAGEVAQTFGLVQEGTTWFSDPPKGGGPPDTQLQVRVLGVDPAPPAPLPPPLPPPPPPKEPGDASSSGTGGDGATGEVTSGAVTGGDVLTTGEPTGETAGPGPGGPALPPGAGADADDAGCGCRGSAAPGGALALLGLLLVRRRRGRRDMSRGT